MLKKILFAVFAVISFAATAQLPADWKEMKGDINLFIANDLGRNGYYEQKPIATLMGEMAEVIGPEAILALGDTHHFNGVQSVDDPLWISNYESIYSHPELMIDWFPVCGNHEYRGDTEAVISYSEISRRWEMPARYYSKVFTDGDLKLRVIFIDTTPLIDKYRTDSINYPDASKQNIAEQLEWLEKTLEKADEDWVIVAGHHPIYADTPKAESERDDMQKRVDSILRKHKVDMYICGHIHNFQHIRKPDSGIDYVVNSSGSLSRKKVKNIEGTVFVSGEPGFSIIQCSPDELNLIMMDSDGNPIHKVSQTRKK